MPSEDTQFKPGQSGNPSGRPKGAVSIIKKIRQRLLEDPNQLEQLVDAAIQQAKDSPQGMKALLDRFDGPVTQNVNVSQLSNEQLVALLTQGVDGGSEEEGA